MNNIENIAPIGAVESPANLLAVVGRVRDYYTINCRKRANPLPETPELLNFARKLEQITNREFEVFEKVIQGLTAVKIGKELGISPRTVDVHKARFIQKMGIGNMVIAARYFSVLETLIVMNDLQVAPPTLAKTG
ncbi:LuxR C-terminal-related transcriptional regulator [Maritalea sp.]|uniref:LuxR C-terminal-related transcriptional regulator n=1 Tax=Maritalea sp. TaxID=2003361 RepID=UPI003EFA979C